MTYDQYWQSNYWDEWVFLEADRLRQKRANEQAWLQGLYIYDAFGSVLANAFSKKGTNAVKYPEKPYDFGQKEETPQKKIEAERKRAFAYLNGFAKHKKRIEDAEVIGSG
jgi:hypothetical protein